MSIARNARGSDWLTVGHEELVEQLRAEQRKVIELSHRPTASEVHALRTTVLRLTDALNRAADEQDVSRSKWHGAERSLSSSLRACQEELHMLRQSFNGLRQKHSEQMEDHQRFRETVVREKLHLQEQLDQVTVLAPLPCLRPNFTNRKHLKQTLHNRK